jgi:hypothetical protein
MMFREVLHMGKGHWAVVVRDALTGRGMFVDGANKVTEEIARKAFGRAIRASELGLPVDGEMVSAIRLLKVNARADDGDVVDWAVQQQHDVGSLKRWKDAAAKDRESAPGSLAQRGSPPYHDETVPLGLPCYPGAWGGDGCAMHSGFDRDENGICVEGHRAVKALDLIIVPKAMQDRSGFPSTMTREEVDLVMAETVSELVHREKGEALTDEQLNKVLEILEARKAKHDRRITTEFPNDSPVQV